MRRTFLRDRRDDAQARIVVGQVVQISTSGTISLYAVEKDNRALDPSQIAQTAEIENSSPLFGALCTTSYHAS